MIQADIERMLFLVVTVSVAGAGLVVGRRQRELWPAAVGALLLLSAAAECVAPGRALFGQQPFLAGSGLTRVLVLESDGAVRRALEPWSWALSLMLSWGALRSRRAILVGAVAILACLRAAECAVLSSAWPVPPGASGAATVAALLALCAVAVAFRGVEPSRSAPDVARTATLCLLAHSGIAMSLLLSAPRPVVAVGAHYYSWFPENWAASYIGQKLIPAVQPMLGEYDSSDLKIFEKHTAWANEAGIDLFIFDWWSKRPNVRRRVLQQAELLDEKRSMQFALHYEALDLKETKDTPVPGEDSNVVVMTPERAERLKRQWEYLAKHYMNRPSYFRERGAAVLFVYATRHLVGPVREAIDAARRHVKASTGVDLFIVGDEVYFNVLRYDRTRGVYLLPEGVPDWDRLLAFDAITAYNPYDESRPQHGGSAGAERFVADVERLYARYRGVAATAGIRFIPTVLPGYNDRGVRPKEDHFVIPRIAGGESFFARSLAAFAQCRFTKASGLVVVTSWNEWNEGTQIEPAALSPLTHEDVSGSDQFSAGELLGGYGTQHLVELRGLPRGCP